MVLMSSRRVRSVLLRCVLVGFFLEVGKQSWCLDGAGVFAFFTFACPRGRIVGLGSETFLTVLFRAVWGAAVLSGSCA